ncbi:STT3 domain-containing protein [Thermococcus sp. Bubb.Bath]|uniref:STT3 domain-containing protein n=1 Tax=Thermococcus sp. Bubb.Bath TaxID=1638242 RepID=UPI001438A4C9|nr:STT3 domain-containing protein [Thermococcus sp. Bubb.Bath]NJF26143.1 peptide transporter [Thermococcus sp. Bubb.Bath]
MTRKGRKRVRTEEKKGSRESTDEQNGNTRALLMIFKKNAAWVIALIAFIIRLIPYRLKYPIGYDPYFHLAYLEYVSSHGWVNYFTYALGPRGILMDHFHPKGMWATPYIVYRILKPFGTSVYGAFKLTPPIFGALTVVAVYYGVKRLYGWKAAAWTSLFLTLSFGHIFRSMSNYYRGDNYALFWYSVVFLLFAYALKSEREKKKKLEFYLLAGTAAGLSSMFWSAYYIVLALPLLTALFVAAYSLIGENRTYDAAMMALSTGLGAILASLLGRIAGFGMLWSENWQGEQVIKLTGIPPGPLNDAYLALHLLLLLPGTLLIILAVRWAVRLPQEKRRVIAWGLGVLTALALIVTIWRYGSILNTLSVGLSPSGTSTATAEMNRPGWEDLKTAYYTLLFLAPLYTLAFRKRRVENAVSLSVVLPLTAMIFYWNRFLFIGSLGIAMAAGIGASETLEFLKNERKTAALVVIGLLTIGLAYQSINTTSHLSPIANDHWEKALTYLRDHSYDNDVVMTWWDHGDWVTYFAHRAPVAQGTPSELTAKFYLGEVPKETLLDYGVDYVTVSYDTMLKWDSLLSTAGYHGSGYVLIIMAPVQASGRTIVFSWGGYSAVVEVNNKNATWNVLVRAGGVSFVPEETWVEKGNETFMVNTYGKKAGNAYLYVNLNYGYAVLMDEKTFSTTFARLMFTNEYPKDYRLVYSDGGMVKIFRLIHPNVEVTWGDSGPILHIINATGDKLVIYGYSDSGKIVFQKTYNVTGITEFKLPQEVKGEVIRYTYMKGDLVLDRGVFRRAGGWD